MAPKSCTGRFAKTFSRAHTHHKPFECHFNEVLHQSEPDSSIEEVRHHPSDGVVALLFSVNVEAQVVRVEELPLMVRGGLEEHACVDAHAA